MAPSPLAQKIARDIISEISSGDLPSGSHLGTEAIAQRFNVSRSPVREALKLLADQQVINQLPNRGYFVGHGSISAQLAGQAAEGLQTPDDVYFRFSEDWLNDAIPGEVTEQFVRERYGLTKSEVQEILSRAAREGWAEPKAGYGWRLRPVAKTAETFEQIYRFRAIIEPAALLEPSFVFDRDIHDRLKRAQQRMLDGDARRLPPEALVKAGSQFHEELIKMSGNMMFFQGLERANQLRRLLEYRTNVNRQRFEAQCVDHLHMLDLVQRGENLEAAHFMKKHLSGALAAKSPLVFGKRV